MVTVLRLFASLLCLYATTGQPSCDSSKAQIEQWTSATVANLKGQGYEVVEGKFHVYNSTGFGANPGNPYVTYFHPGLVRGKEPIFKLGERDAVLFLGCTPRTTAYFSWRSYAFFEGFHLLFASLGDSLNNLVIKTTSKDKSFGGHTAAVVTTADADTYSTVSEALATAGFAKTAHNLDAIPSSLVDMGSTEFIMLHRASVWGSESEKHAYFAQDRKVFFITAPKQGNAKPLPVVPLRKPGDGNNEQDLPEVKANLVTLKQRVMASMSKQGYQLTNETQVFDKHLDGFQCLKDKTNCLGDNRDTHYLVYKDDQFSDDDIYVVLGANSVTTKKCTYTNVGLYKVGGITGKRPTSTSLTIDDRKLAGSADMFGVNSDYVFAYTLKAACNGAKFCLEVRSEIPAKQAWAFAYRTYMEPSTATAPKLSEIVLPTILRFSKTSSVIV